MVPVVATATTAAVKDMLPVPLAARPMAVLLFVQEYVVFGVVVVKFTVVSVPLQVFTLAGWFTCAVGFTVIVTTIGAPAQNTPLFVYVGVTVIVAVTGAPPLLIAVNDGTLPVPLAARPMLVLLFVQLNTVPDTGPLRATTVVAAPLHTVWLVGVALTDGVGFTVIANWIGVPVQETPLFVYVATTVNVLVTGAFVALAAVNAGTLPAPLVGARPMACAVRDQENVVPGTLLVNTTDGTAAPLQYVALATAFTVGTGFTVIVNTIGAPVHVVPDAVSDTEGVTVIVAVTGDVPLLIAVNDAMLPVPFAARPIPGLLFIQMYVVPGTGPLKFTAAVLEPAHTVWLETGSTPGMSSTVKAYVADGRQDVSVGSSSRIAYR